MNERFRHIPDERVKVRIDSISALLALVVRGVGCAALPSFIADNHPAWSASQAPTRRPTCRCGCSRIGI